MSKVAKGSALSGTCPRSGYVWLESKLGRYYVKPTTCKTWRCVICRKKNKQYVCQRIDFGVSTFEHSWFITTTLKKKAGDGPKDADYVAGVWKKFLWKVKQKYPRIVWFKVTEVTKQGQPHLHLIVSCLGGDQDQLGKCEALRKKSSPGWKRENWDVSMCMCLSHELGRYWLKATGDSHVLYATEVEEGKSPSGYLSKYLDKAMYKREELKKLGFDRRWSCSRNWPSPGKIQMQGTVDGSWERVSTHRKSDVGNWDFLVDLEGDPGVQKFGSMDDEVVQMVGEPMALAMYKERERIGKAKEMLRFLDLDNGL